MSNVVPFVIADDYHTQFIVYISLCCFGAVLIVASCASQWHKAAEYGKFALERKSVEHNETAAMMNKSQGPQCPLPQRLAHILSDFPSGIVLVLLLFLLLPRTGRSPPSIFFLVLWLCHYIHRGLLHPLSMRYSAATVPLYICAGGALPNWTFAAAAAIHLASVSYPSPSYFYDPRCIIGTLMFVFGFFVNRWSDFTLRALRSEESQARHPGRRYLVPRGFLFEFISCPNYFGEALMWVGWATATSSLVGVLWATFGLSTFVPRAVATRKWYGETFDGAELPHGGSAQWKALIPFLF